jgi:Fanconi anemia group M protein
MTQEKQIETLRRFKDGEFNVLVGTSISEEGLDVPAVDYAIFYESVPSEIRTIQRRGRVGRQVAGRVAFLLTKDTRDEAYYWSAFHKEKKMKGILFDMRKRLKKKKILKDWVE